MFIFNYFKSIRQLRKKRNSLKSIELLHKRGSKITILDKNNKELKKVTYLSHSKKEYIFDILTGKVKDRSIHVDFPEDMTDEEKIAHCIFTMKYE